MLSLNETLQGPIRAFIYFLAVIFTLVLCAFKTSLEAGYGSIHP